MTKRIRLAASIAVVAASLASAGVASATAVTLTATDILQSYTTTEKDTITFAFAPVVASDLTYSRLVLTVTVDGDTVGPFTGPGSYTLPGYTGSGITIDYQLTPSVPEPATWALMLVGFGTVGAGLRAGARRRLRIA